METASADAVTITGANGYSVTGPALLDYAGTYPEEDQMVSSRDQIGYQGDYTFTPHLIAYGWLPLRRRARGRAGQYRIYSPVERNNYDYLAAVHGDFKNRFFYTLGGSLEHYSLFGTQTSPRAGLTRIMCCARGSGIFSGTRMLFNFGDAVREPSLTDQFYSLYNFLSVEWRTVDDSATADFGPLAAPRRAHL